MEVAHHVNRYKELNNYLYSARRAETTDGDFVLLGNTHDVGIIAAEYRDGYVEPPKPKPLKRTKHFSLLDTLVEIQTFEPLLMGGEKSYRKSSSSNESVVRKDILAVGSWLSLRVAPRDPYALFLLVSHAALTARYHGIGWIRQNTYGRFMNVNQLSIRTGMQFIFAAGILSLKGGAKSMHVYVPPDQRRS